MKNQTIKYEYEGQVVEFNVANKRLMVNATEMGKVFGRMPKDYIRLDRSKRFIQACLSWAEKDKKDPLRKAISPFSGVKSEKDLMTKDQRNGTWMHQIVALDFAAWLDPMFAVWMYVTLNAIMNGGAGVTPLLINDAPERKEILMLIDEKKETIKKAKDRINQTTADDQALIEFETKELQTAQNKLRTLDQKATKTLNKIAQQLDIFNNRDEQDDSESTK